jgi:pyruvate formate lyase activating enzyme
MSANNIKIKGLEKTSLIDYPEKVCSVIFLAGCNFRCPYCHNPDLINSPDKIKDIDPGQVIQYMVSNRKWIDGLCITGGEPTLHNSLPEFIQRVKSEGFLVKLDTNGTNPDMLEELLKNRLLDYVSMDIKAPLNRYDSVASTDTPVNTASIQRSVNLIMKKNSGIGYEFRTTVLPELFQKADALAIGQWLRGANRFFIQQFRPMKTLDTSYRDKKPYTLAELEELKEVMKPYFESVEIRA